MILDIIFMRNSYREVQDRWADFKFDTRELKKYRGFLL